MTRITTLLATALLLLSAHAKSQSFVVEDVRVTGLQRITEGTVFNYLPIEVGDTLTPARSRDAIRELYESGFFQDISFGRDGNILVISVRERPAISSLRFSGNEALKTEDLRNALSSIGLAEGESFDPASLDRIRQELVRQYYNRGKYAVQVEPEVEELSRNRVRITMNIEEGDTAKIKHINIVGNTIFDDDELRESFELDTTNLLSIVRNDDQYSREKLGGDLESLRSYYLDRGYVDFSIESTQVTISPDNKEIYITINVREGDVYTIDEVNLAGNLILNERTIRSLLLTQPGNTFSRKEMEQGIDNITALLANVGYAFANVTPMPRINRNDRTVDLTYQVQPGKRVYVRRVEFEGNTKTNDEVLRREMRQFEGAWFSQAAVDLSRLRLQRLGFFEEVNIETPKVPGTDDQVDVIVSVKEAPSGSFSVGVGFSQVQGLIGTLSVSQDNFLGSGKSIGLNIQVSDISKQFSVNYTNPYWTDSGISRGFFLSYREFNPGEANISTFTTSSAAAGVNFGFPITEVDRIGISGSARTTDISIGDFAFETIDEDGNCNDLNMNGICEETVRTATRPLAISLDANGDGILSNDERDVNTLQTTFSWQRNTTNDALNPTRGSEQSLSGSVTLPGSTRDYFRVRYRYGKFWPVFDPFVLSVRGNVGYGDSFDDFDDNLPVERVEPMRLAGDCQVSDIVTLDDGLPFWEHFFGGGVRDVRGFDDNTLGPKDQFCRAVGGDFKVTGGIDLGVPAPFGATAGSRISVFVDVGNVYRDIDAFDAGELRASAGISVTWRAPVGPIVISFSEPIRDKPGDVTEALQFSFGTLF